MSPRGTLALVGGHEWEDGCSEFDAALLETSGAREVVVIPTAAAFEDPGATVAAASAYFESLGASVRSIDVLHRRDADDGEAARIVGDAAFVYLTSGSPMHLRSVLMHSPLYDAIVTSHNGGAVLAASGAGGRVLCDPMVDPRGGAYTVGLGLVEGMAFLPFHDTAPEHLVERSVDLLPPDAVLAGVDGRTALLRDALGTWRVAGAGSVHLYSEGDVQTFAQASVIDTLKM
ncbi:MAG: Type 1 glutamine amidotransferase-like domain-containing protein [Acidimicrobiia bacterium]